MESPAKFYIIGRCRKRPSDDSGCKSGKPLEAPHPAITNSEGQERGAGSVLVA